MSLRPRTVILGANNVGKTSLLEAIEGILGPGRRGYGLTEDDISRGAAPGTKIRIDLTIRPRHGECFEAEVHAVFGTHVDVYGDGQEQLLIRAEAGIDETDGIFRARARFLKSDGGDDGALTADHRAALAVLLFGASRDARRELHDRFGLWARITDSIDMTDERAETLQKMGIDFGEALVSELLGGAANTSELVGVVARLMGDVLYGGRAATELLFSATPLDLRQLLRQVEMRLRVPGDHEARPLTEHSVGTQSVALFGLFRAYLSALRYEVMAVGIEEPEVHLFPHAARSLVKSIRSLDVQSLVTTHSAAVTDLADPRDLLVLRRDGDRTVASCVPEGYLSDEEIKEISRRVRIAGSGFVFARTVLFVEGQSEELALPLFAEQLGIDFDSLGISVVTVDGSSFRAFSKLLHPQALAIPHLIVCDNDQAVTQLVKDLARTNSLPPGVDPADPHASRAVLEEHGYYWWSSGDFETCLLAAGAAPLFEQAIAEIYGENRLDGYARQLRNQAGGGQPTDQELILRFTRQPRVSKPRIAQRVAELFGERAIVVPDEVQAVLDQAARLARAQMETTADGYPAGESG